MNRTVDRQVCVIKTVAYSLRTDKHTDRQRDTHTDTWTDKSLKTEGPKILSNDIFYLNVIIGVPTSDLDIRAQCWLTLSTKKTYIYLSRYVEFINKE